LFWFFLLWIPVGVVVAGVQGVQGPGRNLALTGVILPAVCLGAALLLRCSLAFYKQRLALVEQAEALGLCFVRRPAPDDYDWLPDLELFRHAVGRGWADHLLVGALDGVAVAVLDYRYLIQDGPVYRGYAEKLA